MKRTLHFRTGLLLCAALFALGAKNSFGLSMQEQTAIDHISAESMRGNLSFLASDALEGRVTPSRGLDVAAEFIAAQFRRAGLEPIAKDGSYFQVANLIQVAPDLDGFQMTFRNGHKELELTGSDVRVRSAGPLDLKDAPVLCLPDSGELPSIEGKVVAAPARRYGGEAALLKLQASKPALILLIGRKGIESPGRSWLLERDAVNVPVLRVGNAAVAEAMSSKQGLTVSIHLAAPRKTEAVARNIGGILRGSDPALRDEYVLVTAHYDHLGTGSGNRIYNGANDNGSGTVSLMEIANALVTLPVHPRRSILFIALYGEEEGLLGAYYYTRHPVEPLKDTIADINLEQMGRTDEHDGSEVGAFAFTGPSYSDLPAVVEAAAKDEGVKVYAKRDADSYFDRSDNYAFALAGIVAHTVVVAFEYPDYHAPGDKWQKIDYANMAKVDRGVAAGVLQIANANDQPKWSNSKEATPFREAAK